MKAFFKYFFGEGEYVEFTNFTLPHLIPIVLMFLAIFAICKFQGAIREWKHEPKIRIALAFILIVTEMSYFWRLVGVTDLAPNPIDHLPITVCGWSVIFCSYLVVTKSQWLFDVSYFWLLSGTVFALITPTVITYTGPTRFRYYQFWLEHTMGYVAIFYMVFVHKMRPHFKSMRRATLWLAVLAVIAYFANRMLGPGANYLFMAAPEDTPSVLDILPPNFALRACIMAGVIILMFNLAYLPWLLKDRKAKKATVK